MYVSRRKQVDVTVFMPNGCFMKVWVESYTSFQELKFLVLAKLDIQTRHHWRYGFFEQVEKTNSFEERFMEDHHNVVDFVCSWEILSRQNTGNYKTARLFFVLKVPPAYLEDEELISKFQFSQFSYHLSLGKFRVSNQDLVKLASLHL